MSREEREAVLAEVDGVSWGKRRQLRELGIRTTAGGSRPTVLGSMEAGLEPADIGRRRVLAAAREMPEWRTWRPAHDQKELAAPIHYRPRESG